MTSERLEDRPKKLIVEQLSLKAKPEEIGDTEDLRNEWTSDSVRILQFVVGLEEKFEITLEDADFTIENFRTVSRIAAVVRSKKPDV